MKISRGRALTALALTFTLTVGEALRSHGYQTFYSGKWHLGGPGYLPQDQGFEVVVDDASLGSPGKDPLVGDRLTESALKFLDARDAARPFFRSDDPLQASGTGAREVVVLLDQSYSMAYGDRWERARTAAREALNGLGPSDRGSVVLFSSNAEINTLVFNAGLLNAPQSATNPVPCVALPCPIAVAVTNGPAEAIQHLNSDFGLFVQDTWTMDRLTLNFGGRYDKFNASIPAQSAAAVGATQSGSNPPTSSNGKTSCGVACFLPVRPTR